MADEPDGRGSPGTRVSPAGDGGSLRWVRAAARAALLLSLATMVAILALWRLGEPAPDAGVVPASSPAVPPARFPEKAPAHPATAVSAATVPVASARSVPEAAAGGAHPIRLRIPALHLSAPVDAVGVAPDGFVAVPADPRRVGWYRFGAAPGAAAGSVVITGHVDSRVRGAGALFELRSLPVGSAVMVQTASGSLTYRVRSRETIRKSGLPLTRIFARDGTPRLTLVTCGGPFDAATHHYLDNVVVTAVPVRP